MKRFNPLPDFDSSVAHDAQNPEQYYSVPKTEWDRALVAHLALGHPDSPDDRYFAALPDDFILKVRPYLANQDNSDYVEQEHFVDIPANRIVPDFVQLIS